MSTTTTEDLNALADAEETRLVQLIQTATENLREARDRICRDADERHDRALDCQEALSRLESAESMLRDFWAIPSDVVLLDYLSRPEGQRAAWLERTLQAHRKGGVS